MTHEEAEHLAEDLITLEGVGRMAPMSNLEKILIFYYIPVTSPTAIAAAHDGVMPARLTENVRNWKNDLTRAFTHPLCPLVSLGRDGRWTFNVTKGKERTSSHG